MAIDKYEYGGTSSKINDLILYVENTTILAKKRDELFEIFYLSNRKLSVENLVIDSLIDLAKMGYKQEIKERLATTRQEDIEFGNYFSNQYLHWIKENERLGTLPETSTVLSTNKHRKTKTSATNNTLTEEPMDNLPYPLNLVNKLAVNGNRLELPKTFRFSQKEYSDVKTELFKAGGKYKKNGFEFEESAQDVLDRMVNGGKYNLKKEFRFFATEDSLGDLLVSHADVQKRKSFLEPSAGDGALIKAIRRELPEAHIDYCELMEINQKKLRSIDNTTFICADFLQFKTVSDSKYDCIIANPPFAKNQDIDHIEQMYSLLNKGGVLVSIASTHWQTSGNSKETKFREWIKKVNAKVIQIPAGAFKKSGTIVATTMIIINK